MTPAVSEPKNAAIQPGSDARGQLLRLRSALAHSIRADQVETILGSLGGAIDQVMVENAGMADELIGLYEQIGVIFDITRKLPEVQRESEILVLFLRSLRRSFEHRTVQLVRRGGAGIWKFHDSDQPIAPWCDALLTKAAAQAKIVIEALPPGESARELMFAPIFSGKDLVAVLTLARAPAAPAFRAGEMLLLESLTTFCGDLIRNHRLVRELERMSVSMVRSLVNAVDQKDEYTSGHSLRVAYYATMLGRRLDLSGTDLQMLEWSALLHDVGKIGIRDSVLKKEGKLTDEEFAHIKEHPVRSFTVVQGIPQLAGALDGILYHHERYDGRGYPKGLSGESIPYQARIIQIADVFDALTSNRSYRRAYTWEAALEIMDKEAGTALDPALEKTFAALIREHLSGSASWEELTRRGVQYTEGVGGSTAEGTDD